MSSVLERTRLPIVPEPSTTRAHVPSPTPALHAPALHAPILHAPSLRASGMSAAMLMLAILVVTTSAAAQVGIWRTYTSMHEVRDLAQDGASIWAATSGGVYQFTPATGRFRTFTNIDGLTSIDISAVDVDATGLLVAGSTTGVLDVRTPSGAWYSVNDIARAITMPKRGITVLRAVGDRFYVGTDFGLTVFDPIRREFGGTFIKFGSLPSQSGVTDLLITTDSIWIATASGVACADRRNANLQDPANWRAFTAADGLPNAPVTALAMFMGVVMAGTDQGIYALDGDRWNYVPEGPGDREVRRMVLASDGLFAMTTTGLFLLTSRTSSRQIGESVAVPGYPMNANFTDVVAMPGGSVYAGTQLGLGTPEPQKWAFRVPDGPASNRARSLSLDAEGRVWFATASEPDGRGAFMYDGTTWLSLSRSTDPTLPSNGIYASAPDRDGSMWFGTWGYGIVHRLENGVLELYNSTTVPGFPGLASAPNYSPVSAAAIDAAGRMWFTHIKSGSGAVLSCRDTDGTWAFIANTPQPSMTDPMQLVIDSYGTKWCAVDAGFRGLVGYNENGTLSNTADDTWFRLDTSDPAFISANSARILSLAVDALGDLWIGTETGLRAIYDTRSTRNVSRMCYTTICNIEGQSINCIAIDAVNNKWLGTNNGVFVLAADGATILAQYDKDNSPLLDNTIRGILVHPTTGVAWFATAKGISSLSTPYVQPSVVGEGLRVSPNPFHPEKDGQVQVEGLPEGASLKIMSLSGDVVANVPSPGGSIGFWDGRDNHGVLVSSGVYVIAGANIDGTQVAVGKVAVVRE